MQSIQVATGFFYLNHQFSFSPSCFPWKYSYIVMYIYIQRKVINTIYALVYSSQSYCYQSVDDKTGHVIRNVYWLRAFCELRSLIRMKLRFITVCDEAISILFRDQLGQCYQNGDNWIFRGLTYHIKTERKLDWGWYTKIEVNFHQCGSSLKSGKSYCSVTRHWGLVYRVRIIFLLVCIYGFVLDDIR